jgi:hypothetical protein
MSSLHSARGVGLNIGKPNNANLNGASDTSPSPSSTILDTLKKKMNLLKEELETSKDELERSRLQLDEEKRRRECVSELFILYCHIYPLKSSIFQIDL